MKIFPIIAMILIGSMGALPFAATFFGAGVSRIPSVTSVQKDKCKVGEKDKYGRCPYTGSSGFRAFSTSGIGGTGSFGGTK